jgi:hypothetical protein
LLLVVDGKVADYSHYITKGENNNVELRVIKPCYVKFSFVPTDGIYNDSDTICVSVDNSEEEILTSYGVGISKEYCKSTPQIVGAGAYVSAGIHIKAYWTINKSGNKNSYADTYLILNDTTIKINY